MMSECWLRHVKQFGPAQDKNCISLTECNKHIAKRNPRTTPSYVTCLLLARVCVSHQTREWRLGNIHAQWDAVVACSTRNSHDEKVQNETSYDAALQSSAWFLCCLRNTRFSFVYALTTHASFTAVITSQVTLYVRSVPKNKDHRHT